VRKFNEEVTVRDTCCERYDDAVRRSNQEEPEAAAAVFLASLAYSVARLVDDATSRPAEISGFEGTRDQLAGLTLGKTAAPGESEGETEGPVTPQSASGAADMTHYVGDSCPGGHRSEAEIVENKMAEALLKQIGVGGGEVSELAKEIEHRLAMRRSGSSSHRSEYLTEIADRLAAIEAEQSSHAGGHDDIQLRLEALEAKEPPVDAPGRGEVRKRNGPTTAPSEQAGAGGQVAAPGATPGLRTKVASPANLLDRLDACINAMEGWRASRHERIALIAADREAVRRKVLREAAVRLECIDTKADDHRWMASAEVRSAGLVYAAAMLRDFVLEEKPEKLREVPGDE